MDGLQTLAGLVALCLFVVVPLMLVLRILLSAGQLGGAGDERAHLPRRARSTLCLDCESGRPVVALPNLAGDPSEDALAAWRVPLELQLSPQLSGFLGEHEDLIGGFCDKHPDLFHLAGEEWRDFSEFLERQIEREGVFKGRWFRRPLRLSTTLVRQLVYRKHLAQAWGARAAWLDALVLERGSDWAEQVAPALVEEFGDAWEDVLPHLEWYAITQRMKLKPRKVLERGREAYQACLDGLRSRELIAHARGIAVKSEDVDAMDPHDFEDLLAKLYGALGYQSIGTPRSSDQGADVLLRKKTERTVIQAKLYSKPVGNKAVQEVIAAREHYCCHHAAVVTNRSFTRSARELAQTARVELVDREGLERLLESYNASLVPRPPGGSRAAAEELRRGPGQREQRPRTGLSAS